MKTVNDIRHNKKHQLRLSFYKQKLLQKEQIDVVTTYLAFLKNYFLQWRILLQRSVAKVI